MDLLEYQAKELFQQVGIPILPSQTIQNTTALKRLQIPYPMVLKSQVRAGAGVRPAGLGLWKIPLMPLPPLRPFSICPLRMSTQR
ncbi:hypothetical protein NON20_03650 [Synechocystis sp. B12]|nr:hypothetical protein NON20_03650 [Synechocystis sp. B12]